MQLFNLKALLKQVRAVGTSWITKPTLEQLEAIRRYEIGLVLDLLPPPPNKVLEVGAGTGWQSQLLAASGYDVSAIDIPSSNYRSDRVWPVTEYDGKNIPFDDHEFDIVFSSNVLEHIPHLYEFNIEIHRIIKPEGVVIHLLPSSSWRFWTNVSEILKFWLIIGNAHGEHARNAFTEIYYFSRRWWVRQFCDAGWKIISIDSNKLFYTGYLIMDSRLTINMRKKLSYVLGGSCNIFILKSNI